jgi:hypothetical protein
LESENQDVAPGEENQSAAERWSPALGVFSLLQVVLMKSWYYKEEINPFQGILSVLIEPNNDSPANPDAYRDFLRYIFWRKFVD